MNKDCNGCFGAAGDDCQKCQGTDKQPSKLDITPELAIAAYNTLIDYCKQFSSETNCGNCIFDKIQYQESDETVCTLNFVSAKYSCGFSNSQISPIIVADRYLDYFTTIMEDRLWQVLAKPVFRWRNRSGLSMNAVRAA